ncbi:hypothetical protein RFI_18181 [Reticulomyxa filosa]|uniref:Uncharacterized protein n=1 Tax=Reticulomyxa filosa TaxID=46433 RepID=X6MYF0_RETFI|nr:hypothetical protein RFI_18181 [Reticulomyxa filosa]|eukprot:ETO19055.1 hypothetical protein RFI_18181 [Reticulomyxa filosa]
MLFVIIMCTYTQCMHIHHIQNVYTFEMNANRADRDVNGDVAKKKIATMMGPLIPWNIVTAVYDHYSTHTFTIEKKILRRWKELQMQAKSKDSAAQTKLDRIPLHFHGSDINADSSKANKKQKNKDKDKNKEKEKEREKDGAISVPKAKDSSKSKTASMSNQASQSTDLPSTQAVIETMSKAKENTSSGMIDLTLPLLHPPEPNAQQDKRGEKRSFSTMNSEALSTQTISVGDTLTQMSQDTSHMVFNPLISPLVGVHVAKKQKIDHPNGNTVHSHDPNINTNTNTSTNTSTNINANANINTSTNANANANANVNINPNPHSLLATQSASSSLETWVRSFKEFHHSERVPLWSNRFVEPIPWFSMNVKPTTPKR